MVDCDRVDADPGSNLAGGDRLDAAHAAQQDLVHMLLRSRTYARTRAPAAATGRLVRAGCSRAAA